jgi:phage/plasmid-associated DNA primase
MDESDPLAPFVDQCCVVAEGRKAGAQQLYLAYVKWVQDNRIKPELSSTRFYHGLRRLFDRKDVSNVVTYHGVSLR